MIMIHVSHHSASVHMGTLLGLDRRQIKIYCKYANLCSHLQCSHYVIYRLPQGTLRNRCSLHLLEFCTILRIHVKSRRFLMYKCNWICCMHQDADAERTTMAVGHQPAGAAAGVNRQNTPGTCTCKHVADVTRPSSERSAGVFIVSH